MSKYSYGYKPDPEDTRDFAFRVEPSVELPTSVDLRSLCSPVRDQGRLGSCTAFAIGVGMREFLTNKEGKYTTKFSPLYLYYKERELEGTIEEDSGAYTRDGFKVLAKTGCCRESYWPYVISKFTTKPSARAEKNCLNRYKISSYTRIPNLAGIKTCLAEGFGVVLGFMVYESFESEETTNTGKMPMPEPGESILGGHAVFCVGYKNDTSWAGGGYLIVKNSWGKEWGDSGYFYMPYAFVNSENVPDMWTAR